MLPDRKRTRLKDFNYSSNGKYFVTICTQDKKKILSEIVGDDHDRPAYRVVAVRRNCR